ncbi:hypothetical protein A6A04_20380 [Paramagnetospirillum marisnigri]|uniref:Uncharacterized protein n=1 Tax=Paramagnetospirillum marisnigri TaxID=1285242 RepID=A0A178MFD0_9PROT|nr:hypothetical protein [Paramagnetospirillum marisnigri]OAN47439.1 hypothetical protein A6A04_20380 [Paramagnetospirillum marisnigri]
MLIATGIITVTHWVVMKKAGTAPTDRLTREGKMTRTALTTAINRILRDERQYAGKLQADGEFGRAKLAYAAIEGITAALRMAGKGDDDAYGERLLETLEAQRNSYCEFWNDEDGVGTSTFSRVINEVESSQ